MTRLYIAYGSNLNIEQMKYRCPTAKIYDTGFLENWELIYRGSRTGAYASIRRKKGEKTPIVVWDIQPEDELNLDRYEGFPIFYYKQNVIANLSQGRKKAMVYIMNPRAKTGAPSMSYIKTITQGYKDNNLPLSYLTNSLNSNILECKRDV